jgi:opacity protein-like surface antigen
MLSANIVAQKPLGSVIPPPPPEHDVVACVSAHAAVGTETANYGNFYVGLGAGIVVPESTSVTISGSITGSGNVNYDDGAAVLGMLGYHFNDFVAGEGELGYSSFDYNNVSGSLTAGGLGTISGTIGVNGNVSTVVGLFNALITPLGKNKISPYVGGGLGFASTDAKVNSLSANGLTATVNSSNNETDLAADGIVGLNFAVTDNLSLGGRYQYLWVNRSSSASAGGVTEKSGDFE